MFRNKVAFPLQFAVLVKEIWRRLERQMRFVLRKNLLRKTPKIKCWSAEILVCTHQPNAEEKRLARCRRDAHVPRIAKQSAIFQKEIVIFQG